jgi:putative ABC transport system ATP-binding protein
VSAELEVQDLTVELQTAGYRIRPLDGLSFTAEDGEMVVLLGPSGCGKTTLISCLAGLLTPTAGTIVFAGQKIGDLKGPELSAYRRQTVGVVFQAFNLIPSLSARSNVMVPLRLAGVPRREARSRADELLGAVGLADRSHHRPAQLSGGQQQRVAIARALVHNPPLIVADEPTAHLDLVQVEGVLRLIRGLAAPGRLVVVATHDNRVTHLADRVVELVPQFAAQIDRPAEQVTLAAGANLFVQGEPSELIYVVESGRLEVLQQLGDGNQDRLAEVGPGQYVGELGPILNLPRSATVRALEDSVLTAYSVQGFRKRFPGAVPGRG